MRVVKSTYYSNWGDLFGYKIAHFVLPALVKIKFLTPNQITLVSFLSFAIGCFLLLFPIFPINIIAGLLIFAGYVGDDIDGQFARETKKYSIIGDYLDKVLDVVKIFLVTFFSALAVYFQSGNIVFILVGFIACFAFLLRYYIKLETMFSAFSRDDKYMDKSAKKRAELEHEMDIFYGKTPKNIPEFLRSLWIKNRMIFIVDEAEFAIFTAIGAALGQLWVSLVIIATAQVAVVIWRAFERGIQLMNGSENLVRPLRK